MSEDIDSDETLFECVIEQGGRLDAVAAAELPDYSRSRIQRWIKAGQVAIDGELIRLPKAKVVAGATLSVQIELEPEGEWLAESMPLDIVYEDGAILVLNKPIGLVVHPAPGHRQGTLLNGLLGYAEGLRAIPRAGIVHRLDRDTSGLMVVAKTLPAQLSLIDQLQRRTVSRRYEAVVEGVPTGGGRVDAPIGRHRQDRKRMAVVAAGKAAITHYRVVRRFQAHSHLSLQLESGRTHQIRVHMQHIHHPLVGDPLYGGRPRFPKGCGEALRQQLQQFRRQALHAVALELIHPVSGERVGWQSRLPDDMQQLLRQLEQLL
ncbi:23S rRNA pseudouridine(1911/1915/1917) synthase RluD [Ectothiorhodospiraceae bacterium BW-2]|nr:23S rRNA pseudouridine(1911/1915/1917) synthase RluD [Ectothiorhodospiraceae bacterium BW-2]